MIACALPRMRRSFGLRRGGPMCCSEDKVLALPAPVVEMLARYRRWRDEQGWGWGEQQALPDFFRWARFLLLGQVFEQLAVAGDWGTAVRAAIGSSPPPGLVLVVVDGSGSLTARCGP